METELKAGIDIKDKFNTGWNNIPSLTALVENYTDAKSDHDIHVRDVDTWLDNLFVRGTAKIKKIPGKSSHVPKVIRKQAEWRYSSLSEPFLSSEDIFDVSPTTYADGDRARQNKVVLNKQFNTQIDKQTFIDEFVRTAVDEGTAIVRVGWEEVSEEVESEIDTFIYEETFDKRTIDTMDQYIAQMQQDPSVLESLPEEVQESIRLSIENSAYFVPVFDGVKSITETITVKNHPTLEVCEYSDLIIDPSCKGNIPKAEFIIHSFDSSKSFLKKSGLYSNIESIKPSDYSTSDTYEDDDPSFNFKDDARKKLIVREYWGFWDINGNGVVVPIVAAWVGTTLIRLEENPFPDKQLPFVVVQYLPVRKAVYGEPDGELIEDNQAIIGATMRGIIDTMGRSATGQVGRAKGALDALNTRRFDSGKNYEYNPNVNPDKVFHMNTYPEIPVSASNMIQMQITDADSLSGVRAFSSTATGGSLNNTATWEKGALDAASKREAGILRRLAKGITDIGRKIISMNAEFLSEEETVRITDEEFVTVRRDDLSGNFDISLSITTAEEDNAKVEKLAFMLQTTAQNQDFEITKMMQVKLFRLQKLPELAKQLEEYQPQPDPIAQERAALEIELLKAQIANENAKAHENFNNGELDKAKVGTEIAKAKEHGSNADRNDLDFLEQEAGLTQERELQKAGEQASANAQLKVLEHELKKSEQ